MRNPWLIVLIITIAAVFAGQCRQADALPSGEGTVIMDVRVIDGDTIEVVIAGETERVRYYSIDAPELGEPGGCAALVANAGLVADGVVLRPGGDGRDRDSYGRLLRRVYQPDGDWIEEMLVEGGHATWR